MDSKVKESLTWPRRQPSNRGGSTPGAPWRAVLAVVLGIGSVMLLAGCDEAPEVQIHEPGVYKGSRDPLLDQAGSDAFREKLRDRLQMVQTDR